LKFRPLQTWKHANPEATLKEVELFGLVRQRISIVFALLGLAILEVAPVLAQAQSPSFVAPPRTIADITAILDQEKPDPKGRRPQDHARRGVARVHDGAARWPWIPQPDGQDAVHLRPSPVLGAVHHHRDGG